ncbi:thermonuclease family protein [Chitinophagaceae bacterium LB-8]|uniref:Thermonuclease family protein n=1 Tax=Paraflavisolibacter caeni TaxID=2982496 RepID=A0A9X3BET2_9BACT|nr:thermonuclease family protein [Paraflavisolibacter caeni]MCU7547614.1 thermonuclease family protein [Paraflavisolibacter caeni]
MKRFYLFIFPLLFFISSCRQQNTEEGLHGKAVNIPDGDTFTLLTSDNKTMRIRLYGIDAPERGQDFYQASKQYLGDLLRGKNITVKVRDTDQYKRIVGEVYLMDKRNVNQAMIEAGLAWHYKQFSKDYNLAIAEEKAKERRLGLWQQPNAQPPWEWRRDKRNKSKRKVMDKS